MFVATEEEQKKKKKGSNSFANKPIKLFVLFVICMYTCGYAKRPVSKRTLIFDWSVNNRSGYCRTWSPKILRVPVFASWQMKKKWHNSQTLNTSEERKSPKSAFRWRNLDGEWDRHFRKRLNLQTFRWAVSFWVQSGRKWRYLNSCWSKQWWAAATLRLESEMNIGKGELLLL